MPGLERIKILASEVKDTAVLEIVNYLLSREDMNDKYLNDEKTLKQMISFIKSKAKEKSHDGMAMIKDEEVFGWAIHYWDETNEKLELDNTTKTINKTEKEILNKVKKEVVPEGQLTLF